MNSPLTATTPPSSATRPIRVTLVEDDPIQRESLLSILREAGQCEITEAFSNALEAIEALPRIRPDVVLVDIGLHPSVHGGIELVRKLKPALPMTHFMMLTVLEDAESLFAALQAGATGYLVKNDAQKRLADAVKEIHAGGSPMSSQIAKYVVEALKGPASGGSGAYHLSPCQNKILNELASGYLYKEIADHLKISMGTLKTQIRRIYEKLHARNRTEALRKTGRD